MKKKIVILVSGNGSTMQAIADKCEHISIVDVISDKCNAGAMDRARNACVPNSVVQRGEHETREKYFERLSRHVNARYPELIVLAGFMRVLPRSFIDSVPPIINIHPSLLPKYKGLNTYERVMQSDDTEHGFTIHRVTEELDSGPIIYQRSIDIERNNSLFFDDNADSLERRTKEFEQFFYPLIIDHIAQGNVKLDGSTNMKKIINEKKIYKCGGYPFGIG